MNNHLALVDSRPQFYVLGSDRIAVPCHLQTWAARFSFEAADRVVKQTDIGEARISTVFMGLNHNFGDGPPLLFETMIFGGPFDGQQARCSTWLEAEALHERTCVRLREFNGKTEP